MISNFVFDLGLHWYCRNCGIRKLLLSSLANLPQVPEALGGALQQAPGGMFPQSPSAGGTRNLVNVVELPSPVDKAALAKATRYVSRFAGVVLLLLHVKYLLYQHIWSCRLQHGCSSVASIRTICAHVNSPS